MGIIDKIFRKDEQSSNKEHETRNDFMDAQAADRGPTRFRDIRYYAQPDHSDYSTLSDMFKKMGIANKVVSKPASDMTRNGFRIVMPEDTDKQAIYQKALDDLKINSALKQEMIFTRLFGDGYANIDVDEISPTSLDKVIDPHNIKNIGFIHAFGQDKVEDVVYNEDVTSAMYGKEENVVLKPVNPSTTYTGSGQLKPIPAKKAVTIDHSRYFHESNDRMETDRYGTSVLTTCYDQIHTLDTALYSVGKILYNYQQLVFKSDTILHMLVDERLEAMRKLSRGFSTMGIFACGKDEDLSVISANASDVDKLVDFCWQSLASASNIPKTVLTGQQTGAIAGAQYDINNYYDGIKAMQESVLKPQIEYIVQLLMYATDIGEGYEDPDSINWHIEFNPLWTADDETQSKTLLNNSQAMSALVGSGIFDPPEAKDTLTGQHNSVQAKFDSADDLANLSEQELQDYRQAIEDFIHGKQHDKQ